jgi:DNA-binding GntR family transcriptional regulator
MPKKYGVKEKDLVVSHVVNLVLTGKLRSGDRLDRNEIAEQLGLSRVPVQEAVVQLEHDGVLSTRYHRGAFVERFDADSVLENHELYGVLNGIASARAAADPSERLLHRLDMLYDKLRSANGPRKFHQMASTYRKTINDEYAGPRLQAAIKASRLLVPNSFWTHGLDRQAELLPSYTAETAAIRARDADAARDACVGRAEVMGRLMLAELVRRRVLPPASSLSRHGALRSE